MEKKRIKEEKRFRINCCWVALGLCVVIIVCFGMFFDYSAKLNKDGVEIVKLKNFKKEVEKKNGREQEQINELKKEVQELKKKIETGH